jgi:hypothetical protein
MALLDMRTNIGVGDDTTSSCNSFDRLLLVDVRAARNLRNRNMMGTVSPRVEISFPHSRGVPSWESSVCNETTEPVWNQSTFFLIPRQAHGFSVRVLSGGKNLGGFDFSLVDNPLFDPTIGWFPLDEDRGEVHLGWRVFPLVHMAELPEQVAAQQQELEEMQRQHRIEVTALQAQLEASDRRVAELDGGKDQAFQHISQENASLTSQNSTLSTQLDISESKNTELNGRIHEMEQLSMQERAKRAFSQVAASMEVAAEKTSKAIHDFKESETYQKGVEKAKEGASQAKEMASKGLASMQDMWNRRNEPSSSSSSSSK